DDEDFHSSEKREMGGGSHKLMVISTSSVCVSRLMSVAKVPNAGEDHSNTVFICRGDHLGVTHTAARLHDGLRARLCDHVDAVAKREECVRCNDGPVQLEAGVLCLDRGDARGVDTAHLAGTDAERASPRTEHDRVRFNE